jgi:hypothetical protein
MFRGTVSVMQRNTKGYWLVGGGIGVLVLFGVVQTLLPRSAKGIAFGVLTVGMLLVYPRLVSRVLKPTFAAVNLYVDQTGVYADDAPMVRREDIVEAYIRPALESRVRRVNDSGARFAITLPAFPLTVELIKRSGAQLNIDPGDEQHGAAILTALGFPVTTSAPNYRHKTTARQWAVTVVVVVVFIVALFGFSIYKSTGH